MKKIVIKIFLIYYFWIIYTLVKLEKNFDFQVWYVFSASYVDAYRSVAVEAHGAHTDLKNIIQQSGMKLNMTDMNPGEPNDDTFVKQVIYSVQNTFLVVCSTQNHKISRTIIYIITTTFHLSLGEISH